MYLRTTRRRNKDGSVVCYGQPARNRRVEGATQAEVLVNLGGEDAWTGTGRSGWWPGSTATSASPTLRPCPRTPPSWSVTG